jgi:hypothetical protein
MKGLRLWRSPSMAWVWMYSTACGSFSGDGQPGGFQKKELKNFAVILSLAIKAVECIYTAEGIQNQRGET